MKKIFIILILAFSYDQFYSQNVYDYRVKTTSNAKDRAKILDLVRIELQKNYDQKFVFVVNKLNVSAGFAWFEGFVHKKDGGNILLEPGEDNHINALLKLKGSQWKIIKMETFIKEVDWDDFFYKTQAPKKIFL
ncbi:hypothetical protein [Chryseobacterium sp. MMS23-Vi53]|uniref:hypothetical protein n=1 Tax=Chryseobacterium sp. MMS23-Vi53 TaxID=3386644 RepID=UPI0039EA699C